MNDFEVDPQPMPPREVIEYIEIPLRRPWLCLLPFVLVFFGSLAAYYVAPRWYRSSTLILVESEKVPEMLTRTVLERSHDRMRVLKQAVLSRTRLERVVRELEPYPEFTAKKTPSEIVIYMRDSINIRTKGEDAFSIDFVHKQPYLAMAVTNRLATLFIEEAGQDREQQLNDANKFIQKQLDEARQALEAREEELRILRTRYAGSLPEELPTNLATRQSLTLERQSLADSLNAQQERLVGLQRNLAVELERPGSVSQTAEAAKSEPERLLAQMRSDLLGLTARYTDEHPEVRRLRAQVARLEAQIAAAPAPGAAQPGRQPVSPAAQALQNQVDELRVDVTTSRAKLTEIDQRIADLDRRVGQTSRVEQEMMAVKLDYGKLQEAYSSMLTKKMEAEMATSLEKQWGGERFKMLDPAYLPDKPDSPKLNMYLAVGLGLGLSLGLGIAVVAELLDHSIKNARELETVLPHPLLVTIPHVAGRRRDRGRILAGDATAHA